MGRDWNVSLSALDNHNYIKQRNPNSNKKIIDFINNNNMIDIWRLQNPDRKRFTWRTDRPCKCSRLDYFLVLESILAMNPISEIHNAYRSDHNSIKLSILKSTQKRGKGLWKMNNALLENRNFVQMIRDEINLIKATYALPIYSEDFIMADNGEFLELTISDTLFLETLLCQLRGQIIKFSKNVKREERREETTLTSEIKKLQESIDSGNNTVNNLNSLRELSLNLENLRERTTKGAIIRSRANIIDNWEKPSKYFLNLEKRNYTNKNIPSLTKEGKEITCSKDILTMQKDFYQDLYSSKHTIPLDNSKYNHLLASLPKISEHKKAELDQPYSIDELIAAIKSSKLNKAPGPDGYSNEFFKYFLQELNVWLFRYFNEAISNKEFSKNSLAGIITCIPKQGKLRNDLKNWRPLTLLNTVYNFFLSMVSNRLKAVLPSIINEDQTGFISGRFIGENTRMVYDAIEYCESTNSTAS